MTFALTTSTPPNHTAVLLRHTQDTDPLLLPFVQAKTATRAEACLVSLIWAVAYPVIKATVRRCLPHDPSAVDDVGAEVLVNLTARLQSMRNGSHKPIPNYTAYVRVAAKNACLTYAAKKREVCFSSFGSGSERKGTENLSPADCLPATTNIEKHVSRRAHLREVWSEILLLPEAQRAVLLLNLRAPDNSSALRFLGATGTTVAQLAGALSLTGDELTELLPLLPMDDAGIAARLSISPMEIRTLRLAARRRLARRARAWM